MTPFVGRALALRLELASAWRKANYAQGYAKLHPQAGSTHLEVGGGLAVFVAAHSPVSGAVGLGLSGPVSEQEIAAIEEFFTSRGARPSIQACPLADESLFAALHQRGFRISHFFSVMLRALTPDWQPAPLPPGMQVTWARPADARDWLSVSARGFEGTGPVTPAVEEVLAPNFHAPHSACCTAWIDGQMAATAGMYPHTGVVELGGASTLVEYRRRGAQTALIEARLASARASGCDYAIILTEPGSDSQRNAQRAGFHLAYTDIVFNQISGLPLPRP